MERRLVFLALAGMVCCASALAQPAYDPAKCAEVAGTLNANWVRLQPTTCSGIEYTDGTKSMAQSGHVQMMGTGGSNLDCTSLGVYDLTLSADKLSLIGNDTWFNVPLTFTRASGQACFTGHWIKNGSDYLGYISADFFAPVTPTPVPTLAEYSLIGLASLMAAVGVVATRRRKI